MAPVVAGIRAGYESDVAFRLYDVDVSDEGITLANQFGIQYVPTFVFVDGSGKVVDTIIGEVSGAELEGALDALR